MSWLKRSLKMASSDYSEVMLLDSLRLYLLAQRIFLSLVLSLKNIIFPTWLYYVSHVNILLYAVWSILRQLLWSQKLQLQYLVKLVLAQQQEWWPYVLISLLEYYFQDITTCFNGWCIYLIIQNSDSLGCLIVIHLEPWIFQYINMLPVKLCKLLMWWEQEFDL